MACRSRPRPTSTVGRPALRVAHRPKALPTHYSSHGGNIARCDRPDSEKPSTALGEACVITNPRSTFLCSLRGDLDLVVLMALRKEPQRRYDSVAQFSDDIRRYLEGLPVLAHKETLSYLATKFVRRNKVGVAAAAAIVLALLIGIIATAWQAKRAIEHRRSPRTRSPCWNGTAREWSARRLRRSMISSSTSSPSSQVSWTSPNPQKKNVSYHRGGARRGQPPGRRELADQPEILAAVQFTLGNSYAAQGKLDLAAQHMQTSLEIRRRVLGPDHPDTAQSMVGLAEQYVYPGKIRGSRNVVA